MQKNPLSTFDGADTIPTCADDTLDTVLHDDQVLPFGCRSFDEWAEGDIYELLGCE